MSIVDKIAGAQDNADGWRLVKGGDNRFYFCFGLGTNGCFVGSPTTVGSTTIATTGVWYHLAAVKSANGFSIFVNGVLEASKPAVAFVDTDSTGLRIGANVQYGAHLNGLVDEVELFDRALSGGEIAAIYAAGARGKCKLPDTTAPLVSCGTSDGAWHNSDVPIACTASDPESGLADIADASFTLTTNVQSGSETANAATNSRQVCNNDDQCATAGPISGNKVDKKPPVTSCVPADGAWHSADVALACSASDGGSGLASPSDASFALATSVSVGTETAAASTASRNVCDAVGNCAAAGPISGNKVDKKPPVVSCAASDGAWHSADVALACPASDGGSGLASPSDASFALATSVPVGTETASASTASRNVCDAVGNCAIAGPINGNKVDKKPPAITITIPAANVTYPFKASVAANYGCADGGSGAASCQGPVANGSPIDTSSMGTKTFTVTSSDNVGNQSTLSVSYTVGPAGGGPAPTLVPTNTALSAAPNPSVVGQAVTFTATVTSSGGGTPTGTVSFKDGGKVIGTATLNAGQAVFVTSALKKGPQKITAVYGGDASFATSTSPLVTQVVQ